MPKVMTYVMSCETLMVVAVSKNTDIVAGSTSFCGSPATQKGVHWITQVDVCLMLWSLLSFEFTLSVLPNDDLRLIYL